jgi:adenylate cyclase
VRVSYPGGRVVAAPRSFSVLEASRSAGIPHVSVCGGRGRCSTCRIRVGHGRDHLPPPSPAEARVLHRIGAPPDVRLACQLRPTHDLAVTPVLAPGGPAAPGAARQPLRAGREQEIAVLFADLRGFTRLAEHKLPFDVVFFLNRYFEAVGSAIQRAGGVANQFTGDGVMALFGADEGPEAGSRHALVAAGEMVASLEELSRQLAADLSVPLRLGIGIHAGPAVVGEMGYADSIYLTAVGDTVHVAARLEQLTKEYACDLVISEDLARRAGFDASAYPRHELTLRNRSAPLALHVIADARAAALAVREPVA